MLWEHGRYDGLGMDALEIVCSWNMNIMTVWEESNTWNKSKTKSIAGNLDTYTNLMEIHHLIKWIKRIILSTITMINNLNK